MPVVIYRSLGQPGLLNYGQALAMSTILMVVCGLALLLIEKFRLPDGVFSELRRCDCLLPVFVKCCFFLLFGLFVCLLTPPIFRSMLELTHLLCLVRRRFPGECPETVQCINP